MIKPAILASPRRAIWPVVDCCFPDLPYTNYSNLSAANIKIPIIDKMDPISILYFLSSKIASTNPRNNG